jgi:polar amino acid transport system substrate-binding protein
MRLHNKLAILCVLFIIEGKLAFFSQEKLFVITEELPPLNYSENGIVLGAATDIVRKVLIEAKINYEIAVYPWARAYSMALNDGNTLIYSLNRTPDRETCFQWIGRVAYKKDDACLYALSGNSAIVPDRDEAYKNYRIAVINKDVNHDFLLCAGYVNIIVTNSFESCIKMLFARRVDLIVSTDEIIKLELEKMGKPYGSVKQVEVLRSSDPYLAASNNTSVVVVALLIKSYDTLVEKGAIPDFSK